MTSFNLPKIKNVLSTRIIGSKLLCFKVVDSTNEVIKQFLNEDEGLTLLADKQTKGRGRLGRSWHSPKELGIYLSVLLKPSLAPERLSSVTLMAGVAVIDAIGPLCKKKLPILKWPNDVLINGRKLAGILCEYCPGKNNSTGALIVGVGVNVNHQDLDFPKTLEQTATSLKIAGGLKLDREPIICSLLEHLDREYQAFLNESISLLIEKWSLRTDLFGREISLSYQGKTYQGKATHLNEEGKLALQTLKGETIFFENGELTCLQ